MKKRSFIAAIAMLVVSAIVLTSATFAWFSMGKKVTVTEFNVGVANADGLLISAYNNKDFDTTVSLDQIRTAGDADLSIPDEGVRVKPVSSAGTGTFVAGYKDDTNTLVTTEPDGSEYYQIPVYIKYSGTENATIALTGTQVKQSGDKDAYKAVRIATNKATGVFAPNSDTGETFKYVPAVNGAETNLNTVKTDASDSTLYFTIEPGVTKVIVYVWLEGTDPSCTDDAAAGGAFDVDLVFVKNT